MDVGGMVEAFDLTRYYGPKVAEVFIFIGPNGAGKTTTIRMLSCLLQPTRGTARVGGHDIVEDPIGVKRIVGLVPENPPLYDRLTGREYLEFVGRLHKVHEVERKRRIDELLEVFKLVEVANQLIVTYSRGMKQKLAFSAAVIHSRPLQFWKLKKNLLSVCRRVNPRRWDRTRQGWKDWGHVRQVLRG